MSRRKARPTRSPVAALPTPSPPRRWWRPVVVVVAIAAAGIGLWAWQREPSPGPPPELPAVRAEPAVAKAIAEAREAVVREPRNDEAWGTLGMVFAAHSFREEAAACYAAAGRMDRSDARWPYLLGVHLSYSDATAAIPYLEEAVANRPPSAEHEATARCKLGEMYLTAGRLDDAKRVFRDQLAKTPGHPRAAFGMGQALAAGGQTREAIEPLTTAATSPFARKRATALLAAAARALGDGDMAATHERTAATLPDDPEWPDPFVAAVVARRVSSKSTLDEVSALEKEGRVVETIPLLERLAREQPTGQVYVMLGTNLVQLNRPADAEKPLREAVRLEPAGVQGHFFLGVSLYFQAKAPATAAARREPLYREAAGSFAKATDLKPDHAIAHLYRGECLKALGDRSGAVESFRRAVESRPELPDLQLALVEALLDAGRADEAATQLKEAERVAPPGHPRLTRLRERLGKKP